MALFNGIPSTGHTSRPDDMIASIGHTFKAGNNEGETRYYDDWVISTTVDHAVSLDFGGGSTHTILEIYAPKDYTKVAYLESFSDHTGEKEILLQGGTEFKVIDAGVRMAEHINEDGETILSAERYMKLQIVGVQGEGNRDFGTPIVVNARNDTPTDTDTGTDSDIDTDTDSGADTETDSDSKDNQSQKDNFPVLGDSSGVCSVPQTGKEVSSVMYILIIASAATTTAFISGLITNRKSRNKAE